MLLLLSGALLTLISLLVGYSLGKNNTVVPPNVEKKINAMYRKVLPDSELGAVPVLTQRELDIERNPQLKEEQEVARREFEALQR